ncbi:hypothetical protein FOMG_17972 [Fusarium oxysporum f. sp. melonis 26406]|uniref:Uncharacterized protein n=1 Tax=Fusarium oxysporum f. sp. melonis 26406 TaxID=1089452 RepID=W9Z1T9_FUSOX|nr:hypothetical protein FOMG_17972 [Fusarium oxysporum f. sp. melonis 26406]
MSSSSGFFRNGFAMHSCPMTQIAPRRQISILIKPSCLRLRKPLEHTISIFLPSWHRTGIKFEIKSDARFSLPYLASSEPEISQLPTLPVSFQLRHFVRSTAKLRLNTVEPRQPAVTF